MAVIPHRFLDRLNPRPSTGMLNTLIIGTFNPGLPIEETLTDQERLLFQGIRDTDKFRRFNEVRNFYDRPQNRFWKIMDVINAPEYYLRNSYKAKNPEGLKYYSGFDRDTVFQRQQQFCAYKGLFITDIVRKINTSSFDVIYNNFADSAIDGLVAEWNTEHIIDTISQFKPAHVIINFGIAGTIPRISEQVDSIKQQFPDIITHALSTSGAAGNTYLDLVADWGRFFN